ncbi:TonB-dependent receptor [Gluconacetobacter johannae DSM 13595]|nr:TonB-dependent receptor [Gluconacetobacter johannae]GBQ91220.1 TonB-dependent receptor [Gluconacetobacter johannae DSM 13595]
MACAAPPAAAQADAPVAKKAALPPAPHAGEDVVVTERRTRSELSVGSALIQKILPGTSPIQALEVLPGVIYTTADPWGSTEQNAALYIHGFAQSQLGFTMDGIPLGDQTYNNYNGLSPQRMISSENVARVSLSAGAGDLGTASTSNLGGTIQTVSSDPSTTRGGRVSQSFGSYAAFRTFGRFDTGTFGGNNRAYISFLRQDARAWDYHEHQGGQQVNVKFLHDGRKDRITFYFSWMDKAEGNEDAVVLPSNVYTRPSFYPELGQAMAYLDKTGAPPKAAGLNFRDYASTALRQDFIGYVRDEHRFSDALTWTTTAYGHRDASAGVVTTPIGASGISKILTAYYPDSDIRSLFGGSGFTNRTTEYSISREGVISNLNYRLGQHEFEVGGWYERNVNTFERRWYPFSATSPLSPYDRPTDPLINQFGNDFHTNTFQTHIQDRWHVTRDLTLQAGFKSSLQYTNGRLTVPGLPASLSPAGSTTAAGGQIDAVDAFLPGFGATWRLSAHDQFFANIQKNMRGYQALGYGYATPWGIPSQAGFENFRQTGKPETSWTYEAGWRFNHPLAAGPLVGIDGQLSYYHVDFSNRLLTVSSSPQITSLTGAASLLENVGGVTTNGADAEFTLHFTHHLSLYDAVSYNKSTYDNNYLSGTAVVATAGKNVVAVPDWMNKFIFAYTDHNLFAQITGDYIGRRYATYLNDLSVSPMVLFGFNGGYTFHHLPVLREGSIQFNVTNLTNTRNWSTILATNASKQFTAYPVAPRQFFVTLTGRF